MSALTIAEVRAQNKAAGQCWFDRRTMRFFNSKIHGGLRRGKFFITSEYMRTPVERRYSIRKVREDYSINTVGEFMGYKSLEEARRAIDTMEVV